MRDVGDALTEPAFSPLAGHWWLLRAALYDALGDDESDPLANPFLHAYPWADAFPDRVPPHPEYAVKLDLWFAGPDDRPAWVEFVSALVAWWLLVALIPAGRALWSAAGQPAGPWPARSDECQGGVVLAVGYSGHRHPLPRDPSV